jgi:pimeloyl-ACP methyl ester carboxylesterase
VSGVANKDDNSALTLHFAHANGFPAASYRKLFAALPTNFEVLALDKFAHTPRFPVSNNWHNQVDELIDYVERRASGPVYAVGHSFGGVVSYMAACQRPDLFKGLIMLDPPVITGLTKVIFALVKATAFIDKLTPAGKSLRRCSSWPKGTDIAAYFKARALFKNMDHDCVQDYVDAVMELRNNHYHLNFDPLVEANIFRKVPSNIEQYYGRLKCPAILVTGEHTAVCVPRLIAPFIRGNKLVHQVFAKGGHMFPLEKPLAVAGLITDTLSEWERAK